MNDTAIIPVGQIRKNSERLKNLFSENIELFNQENVFFATYEEDCKQNLSGWRCKSSTISNPNITAPEYLGLPPPILGTVAKDSNRKCHNIWQHIHLNRCLNEFKNELVNYKYIIKTRTDVEIDLNEVRSRIINNPGKLCLSTDKVFGCETSLFLKIFQENSFIDYIKTIYNKDENYVSLNYKNLLNSINYPGCFAWQWFEFPEEIGEVTIESVKKICKDRATDSAKITSYKVYSEDFPKTITAKGFRVAFSSEKHFAMYALLFTELRPLQHQPLIIIR